MTDAEKKAMNVAIAEEMGWKLHNGGWYWLLSEVQPQGISVPPLYTGSLDAILGVLAKADWSPEDMHAFVRLQENRHHDLSLGFHITYRGEHEYRTEDMYTEVFQLIQRLNPEHLAEDFCRLRKIGPFKE